MQSEPKIDSESPLENDVILTITIDIGNGKVEKLIVKPTDDIDYIVNSFSAQNSLNDYQKEQLYSKIKENIDELKGDLKNEQKNDIDTLVNSLKDMKMNAHIFKPNSP